MFRFLDKKHLCITLALACALATIWPIWLENFRPLSVQMSRSLAVSCRDIILLSPRWKDRSFSFLGFNGSTVAPYYRPICYMAAPKPKNPARLGLRVGKCLSRAGKGRLRRWKKQETGAMDSPFTPADGTVKVHVAFAFAVEEAVEDGDANTTKTTNSCTLLASTDIIS